MLIFGTEFCIYKIEECAWLLLLLLFFRTFHLYKNDIHSSSTHLNLLLVKLDIYILTFYVCLFAIFLFVFILFVFMDFCFNSIVTFKSIHMNLIVFFFYYVLICCSFSMTYSLMD